MLLALIPFIALILCILYSRNIILSITLANITSAIYLSLRHKDFSSLLLNLFGTYKKALDNENILLILFITLLSTIIEILVQGNIIDSYLCVIKNKIRDSHKLKKMTLLIHPLLFLDDYLAVFILKGFMGKLLHFYNIAHEKFAYLLASNATSYCLIIPLSSWGLMLLGQYTYLQKIVSDTILYNPILLVLFTIPFLLYPINSILNAWYIVLTKKSYGIMKKFEQNNSNQSIDINVVPSSYPWFVFFIPFMIFFLSLSVQIIQFFSHHSYTHFIIMPLIKYMTISMGVAYITTLLISLWKNSLTSIISFHFYAIKGVFPPMFLLVSAWTFAFFIKKINIISYLLMLVNISAYESFYPVVFFIFSTLSTITIGSTWGNIALFIPIVAELNISDSILLYTTLGGILSGMIAGSHLTPTSDASLVNSVASNCNIITHYKTHSFYSLSPLIGSFIGFLLLSFLHSKLRYVLLVFTIIPISLISTFLVTFIFNRRYQ